MKRLSVFLIAAAIIAAFGFSSRFDERVMTMTTGAREVSFELWGSGFAVIDWGNGRTQTTQVLNQWITFRHEYSDTIPRTITITGADVTGFYCRNNQLTALDVSKNSALIMLHCGNNQLTELDVSRNIALTHLMCWVNQLTTLDLSRNSMLVHLVCGANQLTTLDLSRNPLLEHMQCYNNELTELIVSNSRLKHLSCLENKLTALDVSSCAALEKLHCYRNQITELDLSRNTALEDLRCDYNELSEEALNNLMTSLHDKDIDEKSINISYNPGTEDSDPKIAEAKGWEVTAFRLRY